MDRQIRTYKTSKAKAVPDYKAALQKTPEGVAQRGKKVSLLRTQFTRGAEELRTARKESIMSDMIKQLTPNADTGERKEQTI